MLAEFCRASWVPFGAATRSSAQLSLLASSFDTGTQYVQSAKRSARSTAFSSCTMLSAHSRTELLHSSMSVTNRVMHRARANSAWCFEFAVLLTGVICILYGRRTLHLFACPANSPSATLLHTILCVQGDAVPSVTMFGATPNDKINLKDHIGSKKAVMFGVPGAFTPGCSKVLLLTPAPMRCACTHSPREAQCAQTYCATCCGCRSQAARAFQA